MPGAVPFGHQKALDGHAHSWMAFLDGEFPSYPEDILVYDLALARYRLAWSAHDAEDPTEYREAYLQMRNPVAMEGLVQLTMGAPVPIYNGGLLLAQVRYWDGRKRKPGLPRGGGPWWIAWMPPEFACT